MVCSIPDDRRSLRAWRDIRCEGRACVRHRSVQGGRNYLSMAGLGIWGGGRIGGLVWFVKLCISYNPGVGRSTVGRIDFDCNA